MPYCPACGHWHGYGYSVEHRHYHARQHGPYQSRLAEPGVRSDEDIKRDVKDALFWDTWVDSTRVNVDAQDGVVTLSGTVASPVEKRAAGDDAWDIPGVVDVVNNLSVQS